MSQTPKPRYTPLGLSLLYLVLAALWILLSDRALDYLIKDKELLGLMQTFKGWFFVAVTAAFLYATINTYHNLISHQLERSENSRRELAERERLHRILTENLTDIIVRLDGQRRVTYANPAFMRLLDDPELDVSGLDEAGLNLPQPLVQWWRQAVSLAQESGQVQREQIALNLGGEKQVYDWMVYPETESNESSSGLLITARDVTALVQVQAALSESQERFKQISENIQEVVLLATADRVLYVNQAYETVWGRSRQSLFDDRGSILDSVLPEDREKAAGIFGLPGDSGSSEIQAEFRIRRPDNSLRWIWARSSAIPQDGQEPRRVWVAADVTPRIMGEQERDLMIAALEQAAEAITITDTSGINIYLNPAREELCGYTKAELLGRTSGLFKGGVHEPAFYRGILEALNRGDIWHGMVRERAKDSRLYETETTISPIKDEQGQVKQFVAVQRDISKERLLEHQLQQAQKMEAIGTLAGGISHDFNNILGAVSGYTELALEEVPQKDKTHHYLEQVQLAVERARRLVKQILTFSRQTKGEMKPMLLSSLVKEALSLLRASLPATIEIKQNITKDLPMVQGDPTQIHQVLMNLCTNASHAMGDAGGELTVSLNPVELDSMGAARLALKPGPYVLLKASDTGAGMSPQVQQRIFDPFFTTKKAGEGTGMGLAVVHGIISAHKGAIEVQSQLGKGSDFMVYLPALEEQALPKPAEVKPIPTGSETILFVDDEKALVELSVPLLQGLGYKVDARLGSQEALRAFRNHPDDYDLVITDLTMPKMTGLELSRELQKIRPGLPIIMCTGFSEAGMAEQARAAGIKAVILKPLSQRNLGEEIRRVLD